MAKLTLNSVANGGPAGITSINANNDLIEAAFENTLSRNGASPNQMAADLDMDNNDIINVGLISAEDVSVDGSDVTGILERANTAVASAEEDANRAEQAALDAQEGLGKPFNTKAEAELYDPVTPPDFIETAGYSAIGDFGGALYKKVVSEPSHLGKIQIAEGSWYEICQLDVTPEMFGAVPDGSTDCTTAIQAAVDYLEPTGGTIVFNPKGRYGISSTITIASYRPVNLFSRMGEIGNVDNAAPLGGYLFPMNDIAGAMIEYTDPTNIDVGYDQHSGTIDGLTFFDQAGDPSDPLVDQRVYSVTAALKLVNFLNGNVRNCSFNRIKGSAIWAQFVIKSNLNDIRVHYCGDTGKPGALRAEERSSSYYMQGCTLRGWKAEVCMNAAYSYIGPAAVNNTFDDWIFEAVPTTYPESNNNFVFCAGSRNIFKSQHVSRNSAAEAFYVSGDRNIVEGNFQSHSGTSIQIDGAYNRISGVLHDSTGSVAVRLVGGFNRASFTGQEVGAIYSTGTNNTIEACTILTSLVVSGPVISLSGNDSSAIGNTVQLPTIVAGVHGIQHAALGGVVAGNVVNNADIAFKLGASGSLAVTGNKTGAATTGHEPGTGNQLAANVNF